jgi:hypothetical protein
MPHPKLNGAVTLAETQAALAATTEQIASAAKARDGALLAGDEAAVDLLDGELAKLRTAAGRYGERINLLAAQEAERENERRVKEKSALIARVEKKFKERDELVAALASMVPAFNKWFKAVITKSREIDAAWNWRPGDRVALMLPRECTPTALAHELFRISHVFTPGGGLNNQDSGLRLPGSKAPNLNVIDQPEKVVPMLKAYEAASKYGSDIMRGRVAPTPVTNGSVLTPMPASNDAAPRSPAQIELAKLLERQSVLAALSSPTPEQDREYGEVVAEVAKAASAVEAEQGANQNVG